MPILGFTGKPGHGKSYGVVANVIVPALEAERTIVTNIPLKLDAITEHLDAKGVRKPPEVVQLTADDLDDLKSEQKTFSEIVPSGAITVLDELWRLWPSGLKANNVPEDHKSFLAEHRHRTDEQGRTAEIVLVTQDLSQVAAFSRVLVERTYEVTKLKEVGLNNRYRVDIYSGIRMNDRGGHLIRKQHGKFDPQVFAFYQSHTFSDSAGDEIEADSRGSALTSASVRFGVPGGLLLCGLGAYGLYGWVQNLGPGTPDVQAAELTEPELRTYAGPAVGSRSDLPPPTVAPVPTAGPYSKKWKLAGVVIADDMQVAYLQSTDGQYRIFELEDCEPIHEELVEYECLVDGERVTSFSGSGGALGRALGLSKPPGS